MRYKFIGKERKHTAGKWYSPGQIIEADKLPNTNFELIKRGEKDGIMESKNSSD